ncbi:hypothetical protein [Pseudomonas syringae group genomosp. 7]|uniref:hypothetical protein n=1 Tax=Pseudomonas syringae group genomosp. 7 TaxID=251699 RepID=UPI000EFF964A|nr:hypothetical protein [Pseudomonas syringae group genomosp. 7]
MEVENFEDVALQLAEFIETAKNSQKLLIENKYFGQALILMYSTMDSLGLLLSTPDQKYATGKTFKAWAGAYFLPHANPELDVTANDLWGARCGVLHTFTAEFNEEQLKGTRQVQYYSGSSSHPLGQAMAKAAKEIDGGGKHVMISLEDLFACFYRALSASVVALVVLCEQDRSHEVKIGKLLQSIRL